jgi:hypothetical protein
VLFAGAAFTAAFFLLFAGFAVSIAFAVALALAGSFSVALAFAGAGFLAGAAGFALAAVFALAWALAPALFLTAAGRALGLAALFFAATGVFGLVEDFFADLLALAAVGFAVAIAYFTVFQVAHIRRGSVAADSAAKRHSQGGFRVRFAGWLIGAVPIRNGWGCPTHWLEGLQTISQNGL